uniref:Glycerol-3-phosphate acyltransferase RAM2/GPAT1-8 HAD-like domain-containing protein n=1 Tax=Aegilops tauschii subsp. strangulata TaxID=200361 RepID=A0A453FSW1_AEGTS
MAKKKLPQRLFSTLLSLIFHSRPWLSSSKGSSSAAAGFPSSPLQRQHLSMANDRLAAARTLVVDVDGGLLRSSPSGLFPYFMLVALEAGGLLRGAVLLLLYPLLCCVGIGGDLALRVMAMAAFCGLQESRFRAGRAVLPKWFMEDVAVEGFEAMRGAKRRVCVTNMPRVMVEGFLWEYLGADVVVGRRMKVVCGFYTGLMEEEEVALEKKKIMLESDAVGLSGSLEFLQHPLPLCCKVLPSFRVRRICTQAQLH